MFNSLGLPLLGGALIGAAVAMMALLDGRIAGISGIVGGLVRPAGTGDAAWRIAFIGGMIAAPALYARAVGGVPEVTVASSIPLLVVAGLLVGFGTSLGSGCTSGHGVCGIARLSPRSIVATAVFMAAGLATVFLARHVVAG